MDTPESEAVGDLLVRRNKYSVGKRDTLAASCLGLTLQGREGRCFALISIDIIPRVAAHP